MMFYVVGRVFLDNAKGALGEADDDLEAEIAQYIFQNPEIKDIQTLFAVKEGEDYHIEMKLEIDPSLTVAQADDIKDRFRSRILEMKGVTHVIIEFDEDDGIRTFDEELIPGRS